MYSQNPLPLKALSSMLILSLSAVISNAQLSQDLGKVLEKADRLLEEAKQLYESARAKSSAQEFIEAGFNLEDARIKYLVLLEIGSGEQQKIASDRLRAVNQLTKLIRDGHVAISAPRPGAPPEKSSEAAPAPPPPSPKEIAPSDLGAKDVVGRIAVPDVSQQKEAEKLIKDLFKEQYAKKAPADRKTLAGLLLDQAAKTRNDPAGFWVLCKEAQEAAIQACDCVAIVRAIEAASSVFDVDGIAMKSSALGLAGKGAKLPEEHASVCLSLMKLIDEMIDADQFEAADKMATAALGSAKKANDAPLLARVTIRSKEVSEAKTLFQGMKKLREVVAKDSENAAANLEVGRFLCYAKGNWDLGLRYLVKGSDATLKALAERELAKSPELTQRLAVAEAWHDLADKEKSPLRRGKLAEHALDLYEDALPNSDGLVKAKIEKRMGALRSSESKLPAAGRSPTRTGLVAWWKFDEGKGTTAANSAGAGNEGTLNGGVEWTAGRLGGALKFNGSTGYVACKPLNLPPAGAAQTISWWHFYTANPVAPQSIITLSDSTPSSSVQPGFKGGQVAVWKYGGTIMVAAMPPSTDAWHHYAYVYDGKRHTLYIDGKVAGTSDVPAQSGNVTKCEFGRWWGGTSHFSGMLDDVRIYNRAIQEPEIKILADAQE